MPKVKQPTLVLVRPDRLGDVIVSSAVLAPTLRNYGHTHHIIWSVKKDYVPLFNGISGISCIACEEISKALQEEETTTIIMLNPDTALEKRLSGKGNIFTWGKTLVDTRKLCLLPEAQEAKNLMQASGFPIDELGYPIVIPQEESPSISLTSKPYIAIHVSAYGKKPTLPVETIMELTAHLQSTGSAVVWLGLGERPDSEWLGNLSMETQSTAFYRPTIPELYTILKRASGVIGRDSGVSHLAAAMGIPTVAIVGPLGKRKAALRWSPVGPKVRTIEIDLRPRLWERDTDYQKRYFAAIKAVDIAEALSSII